eukprot:12457854-Alexandrium_andersonii.AAC.1
MDGARAVNAPGLPPDQAIGKVEFDEAQVNDADASLYRTCVGKALYLARRSPDQQFVAKELTRYPP